MGLTLFKIYIIVMVMYFFLKLTIVVMDNCGYKFPKPEPLLSEEEDNRQQAMAFLSGAIPLFHIYLVISMLALITIAVITFHKDKK